VSVHILTACIYEHHSYTILLLSVQASNCSRMANASEELHYTSYDSVENASQAFAQLPQRPPLSIASLVVGLVTGVTGMCANAVVFVVLVYARRQFGSSVNTLITNQSAMDLFACICLTIAFAMSFPGAPTNYLMLGEIGNNVICFLFRYRVLAIICMNAEKFGLMIITLERYFKIELPGAHLKYYQEWTTVLAVAIPWISGFCTFGIPALVTTKAVPGQCPRMDLPSKDVQMVSQQDLCVHWNSGVLQQSGQCKP